MAQILNTVPISGMIAPTGTTDVFATHSDIYGYGGFRVVSSLVERNAITYARRKAGMIVGVDNNDGSYSYYKLKKVNWDFTNDDWEEWTLSGGISNQEIAFGDANNKFTSSSNFIYDYTNNTLKLKGKNQVGTNIFEINDSNDKLILSVDTDFLFKIYEPSASKSIGLKTPVGLANNLVFTLPTTIGQPGSTLVNDGTGILSWGTLNLAGNKGYSEVITADGNTNTWTITHNLQTINVMVQIFNNTTKKNIEIEIIRVDSDTVQINSPINLPAGTYTILVASMIYSNVSVPSIGGTDGSIQFNQSAVLSGDESLKYIYSLTDGGKKLQLITTWGTQDTESGYEVYSKSEDNNSKILLATLRRNYNQTSDIVPVEIREGVLDLYSTYPTTILKATLAAGGENSGFLELYDSTSSAIARINETSFINGVLTLGSTEIDDAAILKIKSSNIAFNIYDENDNLNLSISKEGNIITKGCINVGDVTEIDAAAVPGNIRYDSNTNQFFGYKGGSTPGWIVLG